VDDIVTKMLDILPDSRQIQLRYPTHKRDLNISQVLKARIGFNNDFFTAAEHPFAGGNDYVPGHAFYSIALPESPYVVVDGEMPYSGDWTGEWGLNFHINVWDCREYLRDFHYTSFSIAHNYGCNIAHWKTYPITQSDLAGRDLPFDPDYFIGAGGQGRNSGQEVSRTAFEYIRDYLGYRLYVDTAASDICFSGTDLVCNIKIRNYGFAAPVNPRPVYIVLINNKGTIIKELLTSADPTQWQPYDPDDSSFTILTHTIRGRMDITGLHNKAYKIGLLLPDGTGALKENPNYCLQMANRDFEWLRNAAGTRRISIIRHAADVSEVVDVVTEEGFETGDFSEFDWILSGYSDWYVTSEEKNAGSFSAQAGSIGDREDSTLTVTLDCKDGDIRFYSKVSSEERYDKLLFFIDGVEQGQWSGEQDWFQESFLVASGTRTF
jgi:hypothetical protein